MGVRRERPAVEQAGNSLNVTFPDGTTRSVPVSELRGPVRGELCCFCGESVDHVDPQHIWLTARWKVGGDERNQSWGAHHSCLIERMHSSVTNTGPFFGA
jgi:hypothetical protein